MFWHSVLLATLVSKGGKKWILSVLHKKEYHSLEVTLKRVHQIRFYRIIHTYKKKKKSPEIHDLC